MKLARSLARVWSRMSGISFTCKGESRPRPLNDLEFILATLVYIAAHVADYLFTVLGVKYNISAEGNPIIQEYINHFGVEKGLLGYKLLICGSIILGMKAVDLAYKSKKTSFRAEYILYGGAVLTTMGGSLWLWLCF